MSYRRSLDSISEYKMVSSASSARTKTHGSLDSSASDYTDYILSIPANETSKEPRLLSESSSYWSWIENVNSDFLTTASETPEYPSSDNIGGEWNNFWLNYNSARNKHMPDSFVYMVTGDTTDDVSEARSTCDEPRYANDNEQFFYMSKDELMESIKCCQRLLQILQTALERHDNKDDNKSDTIFISPIRSVSLGKNLTSIV